MIRVKGQYEGFALQICYFPGLLNATFGISEPLKSLQFFKEKLNGSTLQTLQFFKEDYCTVVESLKLSTEQDAIQEESLGKGSS